MDASAMTTQVSKLRTMGLAELQQKYQEVFGKETKSRNRTQLFSQIARKMQDGTSPGSETPTGPTITARFDKKPRSKNQTKSAAREKKGGAKKSETRVKPVGDRDPRLPKVGTTIERVYKGKKLLVTVEADGFSFSGKSYKSLSALAAHITGAKAINGFLFFELGDYAKKPKGGK